VFIHTIERCFYCPNLLMRLDWNEVSLPRRGTTSSVRGFNPGLNTQLYAAGKTALDNVNYTGWKPMLHCFSERLAVDQGHAGTISLPVVRRGGVK
jgi:hypothetical protein